MEDLPARGDQHFCAVPVHFVLEKRSRGAGGHTGGRRPAVRRGSHCLCGEHIDELLRAPLVPMVCFGAGEPHTARHLPGALCRYPAGRAGTGDRSDRSPTRPLCTASSGRAARRPECAGGFCGISAHSAGRHHQIPGFHQLAIPADPDHQRRAQRHWRCGRCGGRRGLLHLFGDRHRVPQYYFRHLPAAGKRQPAPAVPPAGGPLPAPRLAGKADVCPPRAGQQLPPLHCGPVHRGRDSGDAVCLGNAGAAASLCSHGGRAHRLHRPYSRGRGLHRRLCGSVHDLHRLALQSGGVCGIPGYSAAA